MIGRRKRRAIVGKRRGLLVALVGMPGTREEIIDVETVAATSDDVPLPPASADLVGVRNLDPHLADRSVTLRPPYRLAAEHPILPRRSFVVFAPDVA